MQHENGGASNSTILNWSTSNSEVSYTARLNGAISNSATLKAIRLNSGTLLIKKELLCQLNSIAVAIM